MFYSFLHDLGNTRLSLLAINVAFFLAGLAIKIAIELTINSPVVSKIHMFKPLNDCTTALMSISVIGFASSWMKNHTMLFMYLLCMFPLCLVQFSVSCSCIASDTVQVETIIEAGWNRASNAKRDEAQIKFDCCGLNHPNYVWDPLGHPPCTSLSCCRSNSSEHLCCRGDRGELASEQVKATKADDFCPCSATCMTQIAESFKFIVKIIGSVGLFVSLAEVGGIVLTVAMRDLMNLNFDRARALYR